VGILPLLSEKTKESIRSRRGSVLSLVSASEDMDVLGLRADRSRRVSIFASGASDTGKGTASGEVVMEVLLVQGMMEERTGREGFNGLEDSEAAMARLVRLLCLTAVFDRKATVAARLVVGLDRSLDFFSLSRFSDNEDSENH
jgi:hypothetical protein